MAKMIEVTLELGSGKVSVDLTGYNGKGCAADLALFDGLGEKTKEIHKPEYKQQQGKLQNK